MFEADADIARCYESTLNLPTLKCQFDACVAMKGWLFENRKYFPPKQVSDKMRLFMDIETKCQNGMVDADKFEALCCWLELTKLFYIFIRESTRLSQTTKLSFSFPLVKIPLPGRLQGMDDDISVPVKKRMKKTDLRKFSDSSRDNDWVFVNFSLTPEQAASDIVEQQYIIARHEKLIEKHESKISDLECTVKVFQEMAYKQLALLRGSFEREKRNK